jgi:hypothetical protein
MADNDADRQMGYPRHRSLALSMLCRHNTYADPSESISYYKKPKTSLRQITSSKDFQLYPLFINSKALELVPHIPHKASRTADIVDSLLVIQT